ncbi:MAG: FtsX-like permease family protein [Luteitalea sp.]|nr:FtsX-like permease family protein [Luteitalea sp.]
MCRRLRQYMLVPMRKLTNLLRRKRDRMEQDLDRELRYHIDRRVDDLRTSGLSDAEARRQAAIELGGFAQVQEDVRDTWVVRWLHDVARDVRYGGRTLRKNLGFTFVAVVSLALGIGANAAVFSLCYQLLLQPLPVPEPNRLVNLAAMSPNPGSKECGIAGDCDEVFSYPMFRDLERIQTNFTGIAAHDPFAANLAYRGQTLSGEGVLVSGSYFPVLGLQPALGRLLQPGDDRTVGESPVVVLNHGYWQSRFGSRPTVLNETMVVNGQTVTIVGVAPRGFDGTTLGLKPQVFVPMTMRWLMEPDEERDHENRRSSWIYLFARLKPGVSIERARAAINVPYRAIINDVEAPLLEGRSDQMIARFKAKNLGVEPGARGQSKVSAVTQVPLTLLLGVTTLVLLIACVNIANLLLARAAGRSGEMAMRLSIGASRWHLIAQLLTESSLLALFGGVASLLVARWTMSLARSLVAVDVVGRNLPLHLDASATIAAAALALGTSLLVGLFPALHATRPDVLSALKGQAGQPAGGRGAARFRMSLATAQIALSMVLLVLAGLFTKSLVNISRVDLGLKIDNLVNFGISPMKNGYPLDRSAVLFERLEDELAALPGVTAVASSQIPVLSGSDWWDSVLVEGFDVGPDTDTDALYDEIGPEYFRALGIPLISGREFTRADSLNAPKVAIVNEQFAEKFHLGRHAVGKHMSTGNPALDLEIVGLVRDAKHSNVKEAIPPRFFLPHRQNDAVGFMTFYVRTSLNPEPVMATIRQTVSRLDPNLPVEDLRTMRQQMRDENLVVERFIGVLTAAFAVLATLLAALGLYGVLAYTVAQRTREIGLRMALGATRAQVRRMVLGQVGLMTIVGGTIGLAAAVAVARAAQALLFELQFHDTGVLAAAVIVLTLVALAAGFVPADRAARVDPMRALRYE